MQEDPWRDHIEAAHVSVTNAREGDIHAARLIIDQAIGALSGLMQFDEPDPQKLRLNVLDLSDPRRLVFHEPPDPRQLVYLRSVLLSLKAIQAGTDPVDALHLVNPDNRPADPALGLRDVFLFAQIGEALDRLLERQHTRADKPIEAALREVAKKNHVSVAVAQKAWSKWGSAKGWEDRRSDWK